MSIESIVILGFIAIQAYWNVQATRRINILYHFAYSLGVHTQIFNKAGYDFSDYPLPDSGADFDRQVAEKIAGGKK